MLINFSKLPQVLDIPNKSFPAVIYPGSVFDESIYKCHFLEEYFRKFEFSDLSKYKDITLIRAYAMGDILMLIPVARMLRKKFDYRNVYIATHVDFKIFGKIFPDIKFVTDNLLQYNSFDFGLKYNLDGLLEKDHSTSNDENSKHRVEIYANQFGFSNLKKEDLDWSYKGVIPMPVSLVKDGKKFIGLQIRGSGEVKTLPRDYVIDLANKLSNKFTVVLLDHDKNVGFEGNNIINLCGKLNQIQCISLLSNLDACITMDSGMLWLAHVANCPVLTLLGPTREHERVSLHPQYPEKATSISLSELVGCKPCFETRGYCGGRVKCMKDFPREILTSKILGKLYQMLGDK